MVSPSQILDGSLLEAFVAFAETQNFTHAAKRLHLSQPALFERVRRLGELVEAPLYERVGRSLRLTEAGRKWAAFARESLDRTDALQRELHGETRRDVVTLAAGEGALLYVLGPVLSRFVSKAHGVLHVRTLGALASVEAVCSGEADLGFTVLDLVPPAVEATEVLRAPMCVAVPSRHKLAKKTSAKLAELVDERLVLPPTGRLYRDLVSRFVAMAGHALQPPLEADGWPLMLDFVRNGLGVAVVNGTCKPPAGVKLLPLAELGVVRYVLIRRKGATLSKAAQWLADEIQSLKSVKSSGK
jgi:DNA-binding transcriptional LysR family regulator